MKLSDVFKPKTNVHVIFIFEYLACYFTIHPALSAPVHLSNEIVMLSNTQLAKKTTWSKF